MATSTFASALKIILDDTGFYTRKEWAYFLLVPIKEIDDWIEDRELPAPFQLSLILDAITTSNIANKQLYISGFMEILGLPLKMITPLYNDPDDITMLQYMGII